MTDALLSKFEAIAAARGLIRFGVCNADPFDDVRAVIEQRKADGLSGRLTFTFTDPALSTDVRSSLPWAKRLVVVSSSYPADSPAVGRSGQGRIARFAADDAYAPLRHALGQMAEHLRSTGYKAEVLVDDNRLVDRAAAVRAGVGWWGKNTMVLAPGVGPWMLIGSVATDAELATTRPMLRSCGTCTACLPACPTDALTAGVLDARRCLAAIAQAPGPIPRAFRKPMGDRIYGCDNCLEACPPGRRYMVSSGRSVDGIVDIVSILRSADRTILDRYARFYIPRRQARYLRRNALVALGNTRDSSFVNLLAGYVAHPDWLLRLHAAWALGTIGGVLAIGALSAAQRHETNAEVRDEIALGLEAPSGSKQVR